MAEYLSRFKPQSDHPKIKIGNSISNLPACKWSAAGEIPSVTVSEIPLLKILTAARALVLLINRVCPCDLLSGSQLPRPRVLEETPIMSPLTCILTILATPGNRLVGEGLKSLQFIQIKYLLSCTKDAGDPCWRCHVIETVFFIS